MIVGTDSGVYGTFLHPSGRVEWVTNGALAGRTVLALAYVPSSSSTLLAGTDGGLYKSTNGGVSWTAVTNGPTAAVIISLLFDPAAPLTVYAGTDAGVFVSTDNGATWAPMNVGLTTLAVEAVVRAPGPSGALYAATNGAGVFVFSTELEPRAPVNEAGGRHSPRVVTWP